MNPKVSIIMGSTSDLPIMEKAAKVLDEFGIPFEMNALSAHRTPGQAMEFAREAYGRGRRCSPSAGCCCSPHPGAGHRGSHQGLHIH